MPDRAQQVAEINERLRAEYNETDVEMDYVLPTGEKINPANPSEGVYFQQDQTAYVLFKLSDERVFPTRVVTSFEGDAAEPLHHIGERWTIRHDQTNAMLGTYQVVGIHVFGKRVEGWVPDRKISHSVFK